MFLSRDISHNNAFLYAFVQVMGLLQVVVYTAASKLECQSHPEEAAAHSQNLSGDGAASNIQKDPALQGGESGHQDDKSTSVLGSTSHGNKSTDVYDIFLQLPHSDLRNLCSILGHEG